MPDTKPDPIGIRGIPARFIQTDRDGLVKIAIPLLGAKATVRPEDVVPCTENGRNVPARKNLEFRDPDAEIEVAVRDGDGNPVRKSMTAKELADAFETAKKEYQESRGPKQYLRGLDERFAYRSNVPLNDGTGRNYMAVSVPDPKSVPKPVKRPDGRPVPVQEDTGYGTFLVHPDCVRSNGAPGRVDVYLGRTDDKIPSYKVVTDKNGRTAYEKSERTAKDVTKQYEDDKCTYKGQRAHGDPEAGYPGAKDCAVLKNVTAQDIRNTGDGRREVQAADGTAIAVYPAWIKPAKTADGTRVPGAYDVYLPLDRPMEIVKNPSGRGDLGPADVESAHRARREEICAGAAKLMHRDDPVYVHDVPAADVAFDHDRGVAVVSVPDSESVGKATFEVPIESVLPDGAEPKSPPDKYDKIPIGPADGLLENYTVERPAPDGDGTVQVRSPRLAKEVGSLESGQVRAKAPDPARRLVLPKLPMADKSKDEGLEF